MKVYIQSNERQLSAAKVSKNTFEKFNLDTEIVLIEECNFFKEIINKSYLRRGKKKIYKNDLQSFTLLRFYIPTIHKGKEDFLIVDPDVFAIKNPNIIKENNAENVLYCTFYNNNPRTEVMYFNKINSLWNFQSILEDLLNFKLDYQDLFCLNFNEQNLKVKEINQAFNHHDKINNETILLHTTKRITQPWKLDLKVDFDRNVSFKNIFINNLKKFFGLNYNEELISKKYLKHGSQDVFNFVLQEFSYTIKKGDLDYNQIKKDISNNFLSKTFIDKLKKIENDY